MTFNAKEIAGKIPLWVAYDIHGRKEETYSLIEKALLEAHAAGVKEGLEEAAQIASDHALIKGPHIHKGFDFCVNQVAAEIRLKEPRSE